jgi:shikimate kinase
MKIRTEDVALVYLVGARGCGKSTVGQLLATRIGWDFLDADALLEERAGRSIAELFATEGEAGFREREASLLRELAGRQQHVIATGGGVVLRDQNRRLLRATGLCVWLTGDPATLYGRLLSDPTSRVRRPALTRLPGPAEVERVLREREPLYREVAHLVVATENQSPEAVVSAILSAWASQLTFP